MRYLLDTNVCIRYITGRSEKVKQHIYNTPCQEISVCSVVKSELYYGAMKSQKPEFNLHQQNLFLNQFNSFDFDDKAAKIFGEIRCQLEKQGMPIGAYDTQIAAIALANKLILVTHNTREFSRIPQLTIEDWEV